MRVGEVGLLGRLIRWRIPGINPGITFVELFSQPPFTVLDRDHDRALVSGLVGRIWTLRRDYPCLAHPEEFRTWDKRGTVRVLFANWVQDAADGRHLLASEVRVDPIGIQGRLGLRAMGALISRFQNRIGSDGIETAVRRAEGR